MKLNRQQRRQIQYKRGLGKAKPHFDDWTCPGCGHFYKLIFVQSTDMPYVFCHEGCKEFFDKNNNNATAKVYPSGRPF